MANPSDARPLLVTELLTLALLRLCAVVARNSVVGDRLKVTKLTFLATHRLYEAKRAGLAFSFYRYTYGPFTKELYEVWDDLSAAGMLDVGPGPASAISLTEEGQRFGMEFLTDLFSHKTNEPIAVAFAEVAGRFARESTANLLQDVYRLRVKPVGSDVEVPIADIPMGTHLTKPIVNTRAQGGVEIADDWLIRYDIARQRGWAREEQLVELIGLHAPEVVREIQEALAADLRGETEIMSLGQIEKELGIRRSA